MGRCYEFGVEIHAGCEQAMVVTAEGGACECTQCATTCPGRFAGCAGVVAVPGRIPPSAPAWSIPGGNGRGAGAPMAHQAAGDGGHSSSVVSPAVPAARRAPPPTPVLVSPLAPPPAGNGARAADGKGKSQVDGAALLAQAVDALRDEVRDRDDQLAASLEAYAEYQRRLAEQITRIGETVAALNTGQADHSEKLAAAVDRLTTAVSALEDRLDQPGGLRSLLGRRI